MEFRCEFCNFIFESVSAKACPKCGHGNVNQIIRKTHEFTVKPLNIAKKTELEIPLKVVKKNDRKRK